MMGSATDEDMSSYIQLFARHREIRRTLEEIPGGVRTITESDVPELVTHFCAELTKGGGLPAKEFDTAAVERLTAHDWQGNIRELKNAVERLLILASGPTVTASDVERLVGRGGAGADAGRGKSAGAVGAGGDAAWLRAATFEEFKQAAERAFLLRKLQQHDWNVSETARTLQMPRSNLYKKIERYGLARGGEGAP